MLLDVHFARAASAPDWLHAQMNAPLPAHDEKTDAVELYSETVLTVETTGKITRLERKVFKILRPDGAARGTISVAFDAQTRISNLRGWCIPASGKDFEVTDKDAVVLGLDVANGELVSDVHVKRLRIPAAAPGSIVGYEWQQEQRPYILTDQWRFQDTIPVREARYRLQLPPGWEYKATWLNHADDSPTVLGRGQWLWVLNDIDPIHLERRMPPWRGIAGGLVVALLPPGGKDAGFQTWAGFGAWYQTLVQGRRDVSPQIRQRVAELTASVPTALGKIQALASFVQNDIRYVAVELGIGGYQPHSATEVFSHAYGDCKDKVTLLSAMLKEIGVDSYYVIINTQRGSVTPSTPPNLNFNHVILAIALPGGTEEPELMAKFAHPTLGTVLFFDPTDTLTPFGRLSGALQANYGMLIGRSNGELVELPQLPPAANSLDRSASMTLDDKGTLRGEVHEVWVGDRASAERYALRSANVDTDQIKPVEAVVGASLANFHVLKASVRNLRALARPFEWNYSLEAPNYAKVGDDLLLIRPRLLGAKASLVFEPAETRHNAIEFDAPLRDTDVFEIVIPAGYVLDELPVPVHVETSFGFYDSKTEMDGRVMRYRRTIEISNLTLPAAEADKVTEFCRIIARDERNAAVFKKMSGI